MEKFDIFQDITERTGGSIYIGVVGPVRTGKSTFIKRFMDLMVLPRIEDVHEKERTIDELPQSGAGRTIMTTEPKFVPDEAVEIGLTNNIKCRVRLVDCVGYTVEGAKGYEEETGPRMVRTPWFDHEIPFQEAAEIGTRKVIAEHSTLGLVVTTDGSITEISRENYVAAEERVISELEELGKPFLVVLNSITPEKEETKALARSLEEKYNVAVIPMDCLRMTQEDIMELMHRVLYEFPVREIVIRLPQWVDELAEDHKLSKRFGAAVFETVENIHKLRDVTTAVEAFRQYESVQSVKLATMDLGSGKAVIDLFVDGSLFYQVLQEMTGFAVEGDHHLMRLMQELSAAKKEYDLIAQAFADVRERGYGIVSPRLEDITFDEPELIKKGNRFGVRLTASAPSFHLIRANIVTEVTPFVGTEKQGEEMVRYLTEEFEADPSKIWSSDFLGKSLYELIQEGISSKLHRMPEHAQEKLQETLSKIINEGSGGLICIIL